MKIALYKGTRPGWYGLFNRAVRWWIKSPYSHIELVFSDGISGSSSGVDGGVRLKYINYDASRWDFIDVKNGDEVYARKYIEDRIGWKYDYIGLFGFLFRPIVGERRKQFCSEIVAGALKYRETWRFDPADVAATV